MLYKLTFLILRQHSEAALQERGKLRTKKLVKYLNHALPQDQGNDKTVGLVHQQPLPAN